MIRIILRILLGTAGVVFLAWFFIPGLLTGNFHIGIVTGCILSLMMIIYAVFAGSINKLIAHVWSSIAGKIVLGLIAAAAAALLGLAIACMICIGNGRQHLPDGHQKTVVVLGCRVYSYGPSLMLIARLDEAYEYMLKEPDSVCIVCGGRGSNEPCTESSAMKEYLHALGIDESRIYEDDTSLDTMENLANAAAIIKEHSLDENCVVVTSDFHVYRALKYAGKQGFTDAAALPSYTLWWLFPSQYIREMYGIMEMWFLNHIH